MGFFDCFKSKKDLAVERLLNSNDTSIRYDSALELNFTTNPREVDALISAKNDSDPSVCRVVNQALIHTCRTIKENQGSSYSPQLKKQIRILANDTISSELKSEAISALEHIESTERYQKFSDQQAKKTSVDSARKETKSKSNVFRCPHCKALLQKNSTMIAMGHLGGFVAFDMNRYERCPSCKANIDAIEIIKGTYDEKKWWQI